ncbi:uncharacterized protein C8Q71DRAFT_859302 [Rhodofomes roseus]|uniref:Uncharacterized protein n=1 Tax=Rhodofomes roseus TaxID=34475 RepID=A0ABQ8KBX4_9APHY|nr:uncharacterized protein C8Q71DRAFT_859302 [Rhodofomes roseus]KAH9834964.1 hypothetical protein C8Q71DRAFT_859302 [Rhodofomes roseus]
MLTHKLLTQSPRHRRRPLRPILVIKHKPLASPKVTYSSHLAKERGEVRRLLTERLQFFTGDPVARMRWNAEDFFTFVATKYGVRLEGWPQHLTFANLSRVPGGIRTMRQLCGRIQCGFMHFDRLSREERDVLTVEKAAPGWYVPRPRRATRSDYGKQRVLPWLRLSRPPRQIRMGPKSKPYVDDSDAYETEVEDIEDGEAEVDGGGGGVSDIESASGFDN